MCSTASAAQGGGGESTKNPKPTSKPKSKSPSTPRVEPRKRSSTPTRGVVVTTRSGLKYVDEVVGTGVSPRTGQNVRVQYTGTLEKGTRLDSSVDRGQPLAFRIGTGSVIKGWDEGVMTMKVGGKRRLIIPPYLGYGPAGRPPTIPPNATLIYEVELLSVSADNTTQPNTTRGAGTTTPRTRTGQAGIEFVLIPAGEFMMGSTDGRTDEKPVHRVAINQPFFMGKYEVTQTQWKSMMGNNPSNFEYCDNCPVEFVTWDNAQEFINKLNDTNDGYTYRLPTEAQWEYACRAGSIGDYAGNVDSMAWYKKNSGQKTNPVGSKQANAWGLYDMHGNVWEWCQDWYEGNYYGNSPPSDPEGPSSGHSRVLRGGSWNRNVSFLRSASRDYVTPADRSSNHGFRLVAVAMSDETAQSGPAHTDPGALKPQKKYLTRVSFSDTAEGSSMTIFSDEALNDYSAYRGGDRFYVSIPGADASRVLSGLRGRGFEDVRVQKRGNGVLLSFRLLAGATARVSQKFNRLEITIILPALEIKNSK